MSRFPEPGARHRHQSGLGFVDTAMIGTTVSRYKILSTLGGGGMGIVYEAEDTELGRHVALKFLPPETAQSPAALERFKREARAASTLNHPHICTIHDVGTHEGQPFLVMEKITGQTLKHIISPRGMPPDEIVKLGAQIADALDAAHRAGIVHRDVKPANLFVTEHGDAKVLDFGLAKTSSSAVEAAASTVAGDFLTEAGTAVGTVAYMSPEQAKGQAADARSDIFSLGVVLYEMATGRLPFPGTSAAESFAALLSQEPVPPRQRNPDVPPKLEDAILKALDKEPSLRYQTAADLRGDLRRLMREPSGATGQRAGSASAFGVRPPLPARTVPLSTRGAVIAATVAVLGAAGYFVLRGGSPDGDENPAAGARTPASVAPIPAESIAVLPFADMSEQQDQEYFADGLAEELMGLLSKVRSLKVPARTSSFSFKGTQATVAEIAEALGVAHVLEGSVRKSGDQLRVNAQLVRADDGFLLWSETFDRKLDDVFKVQDEIAAAVVRALEVSLLEGEMPKATPTHSQEAYALYLQARSMHYRGTHEDNVTGIRYLERALELDPGFAPAWFGLGDALVYDFVVFGGSTHDEVRQRAGEAAEQALRLDPGLADAHLLMGRVLGELDWNWPAAEGELRRAVDLDPNNMLALWVLSGYLMIGDRLDEAWSFAQRMAVVDAVSWGSYWGMGDVQLRMGRLRDAEASYRKATELSPTSSAVSTWLGITLLLQGKPEDALAAIDRDPDEGWRRWGRALALDALGRTDDADRELAALSTGFADSRAWTAGSIHACRGDLDEAFAWLERAYRQHEGQLPFVKLDPCATRLTGDPRYGALLKKVGLPQ